MCPTVFTARRYASDVFAVVVCPSVCLFVRPSVTSQHCIETSGRIKLFLAWKLPSSYPGLCYKEIWVSLKMRVLPSGTLFQTPDLENFATASRSRCQQNSSTVDSLRVVAVYYTPVSCNPLTPLL